MSFKYAEIDYNHEINKCVLTMGFTDDQPDIKQEFDNLEQIVNTLSSLKCPEIRIDGKLFVLFGNSYEEAISIGDTGVNEEVEQVDKVDEMVEI